MMWRSWTDEQLGVIKMQYIEIEPCPYCGFTTNECFPYKPVYAQLTFYHVCCADCYMRGPLMNDIKEAITAWNSLFRRDNEQDGNSASLDRPIEKARLRELAEGKGM